MGRLLPLLALLDLALVVVALIDCLSTEGEIRALPRIAWVFIILLFPPVGPIVWFVAGRPAKVTAPADVLAPGGRTVVAPDDDPEFLREVDRRRLDEESEMLRLWEADLRKREDELRKRDEPDPDDD
jgi:hypothetical protein